MDKRDSQKSFSKLDNDVLKFDTNEKNEIVFNHYLVKQENLSRITRKDHKIGQVYLSARNVAEKLKISKTSAQNLIQKFIDLNIIKLIYKSKSRHEPSIYMLTVYDCCTVKTENADNENVEISTIEENKSKFDAKKCTVNGTVKCTVKNEYDTVIPMITEIKSNKKCTVKCTVNGTNKIEDINRNIIYIEQKAPKGACDIPFSEVFEKLWKSYPRKKGKKAAKEKIEKLLKKGISAEELQRCIDRYIKEIEIEDRDEKFIQHGSTFFNGTYEDYLDANYEELEAQQDNEELNDIEKKQLEEQLNKLNESMIKGV